MLRNNKHENDYLQKSFNKYGENCFTFEILEIVNNKEDLILYEQKWIDFYKEKNELYNCCLVAGSFYGKKHSEETKQKLSKIPKGNVMSDEVKQKISNTLKNRKFTQQHRNNLADSSSGERNAMSKLTKEEVISIRKKYIPNEYNYTKLAKEFNISVSQVCRIIKNVRWKEE